MHLHGCDFIDDSILWTIDTVDVWGGGNGNIHNISTTGYYNAAETLRAMGFHHRQVDFTVPLTSSLLSHFGILVIGGNIGGATGRWRDYSAAETLAVRNFVLTGGGLLSIICGDEGTSHMSQMHNDICAQFNLSYTGLAWGTPCVVPVSPLSHTILDGIDTIAGQGVNTVAPVPPAQCLIDSGSHGCIFGINDDFGAGRVAMIFDEQFMWNGPVSDPYTCLYEYDNLQFMKNLFSWLASSCEFCPIDSTTIRFSVNGIVYSIISPQLSLIQDSILRFVPVSPDTFYDGQTVHVCLLAAEDTCGGFLRDSVCWSFFVDLTPPVIYNISPSPDTIINNIGPTISLCLYDSLSGVDTSSIRMWVNSSLVTPSIFWDGSCWRVVWTPFLPFEPGDTINVCVSANDSPDYCSPNNLYACWKFHICTEAETEIICPYPCWQFSSCSTQVAMFRIQEPFHTRIDTMMAYFTISIYRGGTLWTTYQLNEPSPYLWFSGVSDSLVATVTGNWAEGDSVVIKLDSLLTIFGCKTTP